MLRIESLGYFSLSAFASDKTILLLTLYGDFFDGISIVRVIDADKLVFKSFNDILFICSSRNDLLCSDLYIYHSLTSSSPLGLNKVKRNIKNTSVASIIP